MAGLLVLAGCARAPTPSLRIGMNLWPGNEFLYLAQEKGFFADEGANVRLVEYSSLGDTRRAFERGNIDGMACTLTELLQARDRSPRRPVIFMMIDFSNGADVVLAREPVAAIADLKGKQIAVEVAALGPFLLFRALDKVGLGLGDVSMVPMDQTAMLQALADGRVDAAVSYPPTSTTAMRNGNLRALFTSADIPGEVIDVLSLDEDVLERRPEDAARIVRAWNRSLQFATDHTSEAYAIMADREHVEVEEFSDALQGCRLLSVDEQQGFFASDGLLERTIRSTDRVLRALRQLHGPDRTSGCTSRVGFSGTGLQD